MEDDFGALRDFRVRHRNTLPQRMKFVIRNTSGDLVEIFESPIPWGEALEAGFVENTSNKEPTRDQTDEPSPQRSSDKEPLRQALVLPVLSKFVAERREAFVERKVATMRALLGGEEDTAAGVVLFSAAASGLEIRDPQGGDTRIDGCPRTVQLCVKCRQDYVWTSAEDISKDFSRAFRIYLRVSTDPNDSFRYYTGMGEEEMLRDRVERQWGSIIPLFPRANDDALQARPGDERRDRGCAEVFLDRGEKRTDAKRWVLAEERDTPRWPLRFGRQRVLFLKSAEEREALFQKIQNAYRLLVCGERESDVREKMAKQFPDTVAIDKLMNGDEVVFILDTPEACRAREITKEDSVLDNLLDEVESEDYRGMHDPLPDEDAMDDDFQNECWTLVVHVYALSKISGNTLPLSQAVNGG